MKNQAPVDSSSKIIMDIDRLYGIEKESDADTPSLFNDGSQHSLARWVRLARLSFDGKWSAIWKLFRVGNIGLKSFNP
jgi:hypothetical protein